MKTNKEFDCVVLKNAIQEKIIAETAGMNTDELIRYFNASANAGTQSNYPQWQRNLYDDMSVQELYDNIKEYEASRNRMSGELEGEK